MGVRKTLVGRVYTLHITLRGVRPPIWRRVQVWGSLTLATVHDVIQTVFGWTDCHLHQFFIGRVSYGQPNDFDQVVLDEAEVTLAEALGTRIKRFLYVYDFGDDWQHDIVVEKITAGDSGSDRPLCVGGKRHRPPEDCGGPPGYAEFLDTIRDPGHQQRSAMFEWVDGSFDSEAFDLATVNRALAALSLARSRVQ
jgi:Plasmid pRiA4b ORF-3-like protein